jgi:hypothetical protein
MPGRARSPFGVRSLTEATNTWLRTPNGFVH